MRAHFWIIIYLSWITILKPVCGQVKMPIVPDSLMQNAKAVVLDNAETVEIFDKSKVVYTQTKTILILDDSNNNPEKMVRTFYDKFSTIDQMETTISSPDGKKIKKIKKGKMVDQVVFDGITIAQDHRILYYLVFSSKVPYIIKTIMKKTLTQSFFIPPFVPITSESTSILNSQYTVINHDLDNKLRFTSTIWADPIIDATNHSYSWTVKNVPASKGFQLLKKPEKCTIYPILENFQMDNYEGNFASWENFGEWNYHLNKDRDFLDQESKNEIKKIINHTSDKREIIHLLYQYLQHNMRYVSIQLGIGGFQTMTATEVHKNKYGDCKALSNYMKAMLNVANIPSAYILVSAGDKNYFDPLPEFSQNRFNHAMLAVPLEKDTIFLECTAQNNHTGYIGSFTGNRKALWVDGSNSKLIQTTRYNHINNKIENRTEISYENATTPIYTTTRKLEGMSIENQKYHRSITKSDQEFKDYLLENVLINAKNVQVLNRNYAPHEFMVQYENSANTLKANVYNILDLNADCIPSSIINDFIDLNNFKINTGYTIIDDYNILLPADCQIEKLTSDLTFNSNAIDMEIKSSVQDKMVQIHKSIVIKSGDYTQLPKAEKDDIWHHYNKFKTHKIVVNCNGNRP